MASAMMSLKVYTLMLGKLGAKASQQSAQLENAMAFSMKLRPKKNQPLRLVTSMLTLAKKVASD